MYLTGLSVRAIMCKSITVQCCVLNRAARQKQLVANEQQNQHNGIVRRSVKSITYQYCRYSASRYAVYLH